MPFRQWVRSANCAIEGILQAASTQRHLRYHFFSAAFVLLLSYVLGVSRTEFLILALSVIAVLLAEMFNTAIEVIVDIISPEKTEKARIAKHIAAGAALIELQEAFVTSGMSKPAKNAKCPNGRSRNSRRQCSRPDVFRPP